MNTALILIIGIPLIEIYLFIKIGSQIGAFNTVLLILTTAIAGVAYARYEGFNTLKSGMSQLIKNEIPIYEIISGATLAFAAFLLIFPGFATDMFGILLVIPITRKVILGIFINKKKYEKKSKKKNYIDGEFEELGEDDDKKI
ncbi:membrane protein [Pelagibacteraceae bacterium GOM-A1]|nr:membrane protein [Pelagibacteraceae bacterium GOM-A1]